MFGIPASVIKGCYGTRSFKDCSCGYTGLSHPLTDHEVATMRSLVPLFTLSMMRGCVTTYEQIPVYCGCGVARTHHPNADELDKIRNEVMNELKRLAERIQPTTENHWRAVAASVNEQVQDEVRRVTKEAVADAITSIRAALQVEIETIKKIQVLCGFVVFSINSII
jgi:hypothetical protein